MKRFVVVLFLAGVGVIAASPAFASNPNHPLGCHGANNVPCRPDPQPTHGNDCTHSDDHSCEVSTSTTTTSQPPTTTSQVPTPTTTTTVRVASPSLPTVTSTPPVSPTTTTAPLGQTTSAVPSTTATVPSDTTALAETGPGHVSRLLGAGVLLVFAGLWLVWMGRHA